MQSIFLLLIFAWHEWQPQTQCNRVVVFSAAHFFLVLVYSSAARMPRLYERQQHSGPQTDHINSVCWLSGCWCAPDENIPCDLKIPTCLRLVVRLANFYWLHEWRRVFNQIFSFLALSLFFVHTIDKPFDDLLDGNYLWLWKLERCITITMFGNYELFVARQCSHFSPMTSNMIEKKNCSIHSFDSVCLVDVVAVVVVVVIAQQVSADGRRMEIPVLNYPVCMRFCFDQLFEHNLKWDIFLP